MLLVDKLFRGDCCSQLEKRTSHSYPSSDIAGAGLVSHDGGYQLKSPEGSHCKGKKKNKRIGVIILLFLSQYLIETADSVDGLPFKLHDFGYRGATSVEVGFV